MSSLNSSLNRETSSEPTAARPVDDFWRSIDELEDTPKFKEMLTKEYGARPGDLIDPFNRRRFVQLMGASLAFAGVASSSGCRWEEEKIVPLSRRPEGYIPGKPKYYSTAWEVGGFAEGLTVTAFDGRPIKVEGNNKHPYTGSASTAFAQASILELYDPDRSRKVAHRADGKTAPGSMEGAMAVVKTMAESAAASGGKGYAILTESSSSPTIERLRGEIKSKLPNLTWHEYEPWSFDNARLGSVMAFGKPMRPHYLLSSANVLASFDDDIFTNHPAALANSWQFGKARDPKNGTVLRTYAVESMFSLTGAIADHRLPLRAELIKVALLGVEAVLKGQALGTVGGAVLAEEGIAKFLTALAEDLGRNAGKSVVTVGARQPAEVHAIAARINQRLRNNGATVLYTEGRDAPAGVETLAELAKSMAQGNVAGLVILGGNPAYDAPADLDFKTALSKVPLSVHLSSYENETSQLSNWHVPKAHYLESWADARSFDGTVSIVQPLIEPIHGAQSSIDILKVLAGKASVSNQKLVQETYAAMGFSVGKAWRSVLNQGFVPGSTPPKLKDQFPMAGFQVAPLTESQKTGSALANGALEIVFAPSSQTYDGRFANSSWMVEMPDHITKLTWDNAALLSPRTADVLGVKHGEMVRVAVGDASIEIVACVSPGMARNSIGLTLGWGRTRAGNIGGHVDRKVKPIGFDVYPLRNSSAMGFVSGATITATGTMYPLGETQDHFAMDKAGNEQIQKRATNFIKTVTAEEAKKNPLFVKDEGHIKADKELIPPAESRRVNHSLFNEVAYTAPNQWGMTTDLAKCTGCSSCVVACQAENNIPVVGKEQVIKNREMHWIRIDRYFKGNPENPTMAHQPVACQQCENAPCEQVCPVGATVHSIEGLNDMSYNRCVGTRYCANNCPYKVRRFNFHYWHKELDSARADVKKLVFNPEVTVRSRGVIEKCTWCVQRLERAKIEHKNEQVRGGGKGAGLPDGAVQTACQQACPTGAITFGNLADETSRVSQAQRLPRAYALLAGLNVKPRHAYLARITNPNMALSGASDKTQQEDGKHHG